MPKNNLAIFDLDGTLFDTGEVNYFSYKDALSEYGFNLDKDYFVNKCNGRHYTEFLPVIMGSSQYIEAIHDKKKTAYAGNLDKARVNTHLFNIIESIKPNYSLCIVTTASRKNTLDILSAFGYEAYFDLLITQEDVTKVKPDPQGFNLAMKHFGIDKEHTIIFEDSDVGIEAAKRSGATVYAVKQF